MMMPDDTVMCLVLAAVILLWWDDLGFLIWMVVAMFFWSVSGI